MRYLYWDIDHGGVLESFVTLTWNKVAALNFVKKAL